MKFNMGLGRQFLLLPRAAGDSIPPAQLLQVSKEVFHVKSPQFFRQRRRNRRSWTVRRFAAEQFSAGARAICASRIASFIAIPKRPGFLLGRNAQAISDSGRRSLFERGHRRRKPRDGAEGSFRWLQRNGKNERR